MPEQTSSGDGYICGRCGQWVPYNGTHNCMNSYYSIWPTYIFDNILLDRIAKALERIADALEKERG